MWGQLSQTVSIWALGCVEFFGCVEGLLGLKASRPGCLEALEAWRLGGLEAWRLGGLEAWRPWRPGGMEALRPEGASRGG